MSALPFFYRLARTTWGGIHNQFTNYTTKLVVHFYKARSIAYFRELGKTPLLNERFVRYDRPTQVDKNWWSLQGNKIPACEDSHRFAGKTIPSRMPPESPFWLLDNPTSSWATHQTHTQHHLRCRNPTTSGWGLNKSKNSDSSEGYPLYWS